MKKSFIIHTDSLGILDELSDEECGQLFRAVRAFHSDESIELTPLIRVAFAPFKAQFNRDGVKYDGVVDRNRENGKKGGRPPKQPETPIGTDVQPETQGNPEKPKETQNNPVGFSETQHNPNNLDSDSDSDSDSEDIKTLDQSAIDHEFEQVWELYERKGNKKTSKARWMKLKDSNKQDIYNHLPAYLLSTPNKIFRKDFQSYLNLECWNDEVTTNEVNQPNGHTKPNKLTPAQRTRAKADKWRSEQGGNVEAMGSDAGDVRPRVEQPVRGRADRDMGTIIDGDFTRAD